MEREEWMDGKGGVDGWKGKSGWMEREEWMDGKGGVDGWMKGEKTEKNPK